MFKPDLSGEDREDTPAREAPARLSEILTYDCFTLVRIGLLTFLVMVPLITIPPAYMAMNALVRQVLQGKVVRCRDFWPAFKTGFLRSYGAFFVAVLLPVLALACAVFYAGRVEEQPLLFALCVFFYFDFRPLRTGCPPSLSADHSGCSAGPGGAGERLTWLCQSPSCFFSPPLSITASCSSAWPSCR